MKPECIEKYQEDYKEGTWKDYTYSQLGYWVELLMIRASHRANDERRDKDINDARNYLAIMQAKINEEVVESE